MWSIPALAPTPPMGWNSFDAYGVYLDEATAIATMDVMAARLLPFGYRYFVVDMGWYSTYEGRKPGRFPMSGAQPALCMDAHGRYVASPQVFPRGMAWLAQQAHQRGLRFGLHLMRGIPRIAAEEDLPIEGGPYRAAEIADRASVCAWNDFNYGVRADHPGTRAWYESVARLLGSWGVDFVKYDDIVAFPRDVELVANALEAQPRPMVLSLSPGNVVDLADLPSFQRASMVRLTRDVWDRAVCIERCFDAWRRWHEAGAAGCWPDLDMIPLGQLRLCLPPENLTPGGRVPSEGLQRWCQWSRAEHETFLSMLALARSPLMMGGDLLSAGSDVLSRLTNPEWLACHGRASRERRLGRRGEVEAWVAAGEHGQGWAGMFNRGEAAAGAWSPREAGFAAERVEAWDVWAGERVAWSGGEPIEPGGVLLLRTRG